jgi:hypothetical protein
MSDSEATVSLRDTERSAVDAAGRQTDRQTTVQTKGRLLEKVNYYTIKSDTQRNHQLIGKITNHFT